MVWRRSLMVPRDFTKQSRLSQCLPDSSWHCFLLYLNGFGNILDTYSQIRGWIDAGIFYHNVLHYIILYHTIPFLYDAMLYYIMLYYTILYYTILPYTMEERGRGQAQRGRRPKEFGKIFSDRWTDGWKDG